MRLTAEPENWESVIRGRLDKSGGRGFKPENTREVAKTIPELAIKEAILFVGASIDVG